MPRLRDKTVIVTGGARGIGRAIVAKCADEGARVVFLDFDEAAATAALSEVRRAGRAVEFLRADVTKDAEVSAAIAEVQRRHSRIDVLVNNAGVNAYFDAATMTEADWDSVFAVDLKGAWLCAKHVLPRATLAR